MADTTVQEGDQGQWPAMGVEGGETGLVDPSASLDNPAAAEVAREGSGAGEQPPGESTKAGEEAMGETSEKDAVGEVVDEEEGDKTKEGQPAKVGEKRGRETGEGAAGEQVVAEEEAGKEAPKKAKGDEGEEVHHEKKKRGRPAKAKTTKTKPASAEGKKRPVGRPRKATIATGEVAMEESGDPAHHTRSKDTASTRA